MIDRYNETENEYSYNNTVPAGETAEHSLLFTFICPYLLLLMCALIPYISMCIINIRATSYL